MPPKVLTRYEEHHMIKYLIKKYSRDETIVMLNEKIKAIEFENGTLKSDIAELKALIKNKALQIANQPIRKEVDFLKQKCRDLEWQLLSNNIPLPKKYQ